MKVSKTYKNKISSSTREEGELNRNSLDNILLQNSSFFSFAVFTRKLTYLKSTKLLSFGSELDCKKLLLELSLKILDIHIR